MGTEEGASLMRQEEEGNINLKEMAQQMVQKLFFEDKQYKQVWFLIFCFHFQHNSGRTRALSSLTYPTSTFCSLFLLPL